MDGLWYVPPAGLVLLHRKTLNVYFVPCCVALHVDQA